jgi:hypothetical protein
VRDCSVFTFREAGATPFIKEDQTVRSRMPNEPVVRSWRDSLLTSAIDFEKCGEVSNHFS